VPELRGTLAKITASAGGAAAGAASVVSRFVPGKKDEGAQSGGGGEAD
jgi:hypothetical protein